MKFNLSKHAHCEVTETSLEEQRESLTKVTGSYNALLEKTRKNKDDGKVVTTEGELYDVRHKETISDTIEAQLDNQSVGKDMPQRNGHDSHDQLPINLLEEAAYQERVKAFNSATVRDKDTEFWDSILTSDEVKQVPTQLHNHSSRFKNLSKDDVMKNKGVKDMVMASLKDADAMLYHIYRQAATESRDLSEQETDLVNGITADKIRIVETLVVE